MFTINVSETALSACTGDITRQSVDVIVNAANNTLLGGGGVDGAIHRVGGPSILAECKKIAAAQGGCPTGEAVITGAGALPAKWVIHTVGPIWRGGAHQERELLRSCYLRSLELAMHTKPSTIAFPAISAGAYRYPPKEASEVAVAACLDALNSICGSLSEIRFVLFSEELFAIYREILATVQEVSR